MHLAPKTIGGHDYYYILRSERGVKHHQKHIILYLGRLDHLDPTEGRQKLERVRALGLLPLTLEVEAILARFGHTIAPSLDAVDLTAVRSYGPERAIARCAEDLGIVDLIDAQSPKGGGPSLGKMTVALAAYAIVRPGSYWRFVAWYARSSLPEFLHLPPKQVTYEATLNTLDYLQPDRTRTLEAETYARLLQRFPASCDRIDIDSTVVELEGTLCRILAKFGRSKSGGVSKRRQLLITFLVDQRGSLVGHEVFPGNRHDAKTLRRIEERFRTGYDEEVRDATRVVDRGYASLAQVRTWRRRRRRVRFIAALRSLPKGLGLLKAIGKPHEEWEEVEPGVRVASVEREGLQWVVIWNDEAAGRRGDGRAAKIRLAKEDLRRLRRAVRRGRVGGRAERDGKVGAILRRHGVTRFLEVRGSRRGLGFTVRSTGKAVERATQDGYQVVATSEVGLPAAEVFASYRARDRIEKVIRTLKSVLGLGPVGVSTKEHVLGHIYVHALAYELRSVMELRLEEAGVELSPEEALWELEQLQVAELVVKGKEVAVVRKLTRVDGRAMELAQVFSLVDGEESAGSAGGI